MYGTCKRSPAIYVVAGTCCLVFRASYERVGPGASYTSSSFGLLVFGVGACRKASLLTVSLALESWGSVWYVRV